MPTSELAALPYPSAADADNVPADMQSLTAKLDTTVPLVADDAADRDSRLADAGIGQLCVAKDGSAVWVKTANGWVTKAEAPGLWVTLTVNTGYTAVYPVQYRMWGNLVSLRGSVAKSNGSGFGSTDENILTLPDEAAPTGNSVRVALPASVAGDSTIPAINAVISTDGGIYLFSNDNNPQVNLDGCMYWTD